MQATLQYLEDFINEHIPLAKHMDISALEYSGDNILLRAPLSANSNHHATAFGGSIATLGIVAGWSLVHLRLLDEGINTNLVIHKTECEFLKPVHSDFNAHCSIQSQWQAFRHELLDRGKARILLSTQISCQQQVVAQLSSSYAASLAITSGDPKI